MVGASCLQGLKLPAGGIRGTLVFVGSSAALKINLPEIDVIRHCLQYLKGQHFIY